MRLLTAVFVSAEEFLSHYRDQPASEIFLRTRTELSPAEEVLVEISFPELPNKVLVRGVAVAQSAGPGVWIRFSAEDSSTRDFLLALARGELEVRQPAGRHFQRFPASLPVNLESQAGASDSTTEDLSAGGLSIRSSSPPPIGTPVRVTLTLDADDGAEKLQFTGKVAWVRRATGGSGFGVCFDRPSAAGNRRLRTLLRRAGQSGKIEFVN